MNGGLKRFARARLDVNLQYLPLFPFAFKKRTLLRDGLIAVHVEVDFFRGWITVVPEHYLLGRLHVPHLSQLDADTGSWGASEGIPKAEGITSHQPAQ
jgi:hypothetical protein